MYILLVFCFKSSGSVPALVACVHFQAISASKELLKYTKDIFLKMLLFGLKRAENNAAAFI